MLLRACITLLLLATPITAAQQSSDSQQYTLEGTVIDSASGQPIAGALVRGSQTGGKATRTGADGTFRLSGMTNGGNDVFVKKPGYFASDDSAEGPYAANAGASAVPVVIKLIPEGIIYGRISGEDGEALEELQVQILSQHVENGRRTRTAVGMATTDDEGRFRVPGLHPGRYFLMAGPTNNENSSEGPPSAAEGYSTLFYPGVAEVSSAMPIEITPGKHAEINLKLVHQQLYRVSGTVIGIKEEAQATVVAMGPQGQSLGQYHVNPSTGRFDAVGLPSGGCTLLAVSEEKSGLPSIGTVFLQLTADLTGVRISLLAATDIVAKIRKETTRSSGGNGDAGVVQNGVIESDAGALVEPDFSAGTAAADPRFNRGDRPALRAAPAAFISLLPQEDQILPVQFESETVGDLEGSTAVLKSVLPGAYTVRIVPNGPYYVESAKAGSVNLLNEDLTVAPGAAAPPLDIVLRDDGASLVVAPQREGVRAAGTVVLLPDAAQKLVQTQNTDASFTAHFSIMAPGLYRVLALQAGSEPEYESAEFQRKYAAQWQEITLAANQSATLSIELAKAAE